MGERAMATRTANVARAAVAWFVRSALILMMALTLSRRGALAAVPSPLTLAQPPCVSMQSRRAMPSDDLSAAVRVHRGGRALEVWMVTPHSVHWDRVVAAAPSALDQLEEVKWPPAGPTTARFELLGPVAARPALSSLMLLRRGGLRRGIVK